MSMDTLIIGLCLVAAVAFIAHKAYRAIKGTGGCSCGCQCSKATPFSFERGKHEAAAQRCPAKNERKNRVFSAKRQAVWFEMQRVSN